MEPKAIIYNITCQDTDKKYIGQTCTHKKTRGKWYKYGISQRLVEHFGAARRNRTTPIARAIRKYGIEAFTISEIEQCELSVADERESHHILTHNTLVPQGYNVQKQGRLKNGLLFPESTITEAEIKGIRQNGTLAKVRVLLSIENEKERRRFMFGSTPKTFEKSLADAKEFCERVKPKKIILHSSLTDSTELWWSYKEKLDILDEENILRVRSTLFNKKMVRIHIRTKQMTSYKQEKLITFGGKTISKEKAISIANSVVEELKKRHPEALIRIENSLR